MTAPADTAAMSPECALAQQPGYEALHGDCRQTRDVPLPGNSGVLLVRRCACPHHHGHTAP